MKLIGDFQSVREGMRITLSLLHSAGPVMVTPVVGSKVVVDDAEGHTAEALVVAVRGNLVDAVVDWTTWRDDAAMTAAQMRKHFSMPSLLEDSDAPRSGTYAPAPLQRVFVGAR